MFCRRPGRAGRADGDIGACGHIAIYRSPAYVFSIAMPPTTVIPAQAGIYACRLHYGSRLRRWIPAKAGMAANMTTRPRLKQGEQSLGRARFESGGAGKAVFAVGPAGRVGPAAIRDGAGFYIGLSLWYGRCG